MPRTVNAGIYPVYARLICASIATGVNWTMDVIVSLTFLALAGNISTYRWEDYNYEYRPHLKEARYLVRDWRMSEAKKIGRHSARKKKPYHKR